MSAAEMLDEIQSESLQQLLNRVRSHASPLPVGGTQIRQWDEHLSSKPLSRGDVIEIQGPAGSGKSHLVYHLLQTCILPPHDPFRGWGKAAVLFDTDGTFDVRRFRDLLRSRIATLVHPPSASGQATVGLHTAERVLDGALSRLHVFRPQSTLQLAASLLYLEQYLAADRRLQKSELALLAIDSVSAFYWSDRFTVEQFRYGPKAERHKSVNPLRHVIVALERLKASYRPVIVLTNWALNPADRPSSGNTDSEPPVYRQHLHPFLVFQTPEADGETLPESVDPSHSLPAAISQDDPDHIPPLAWPQLSLSIDHHLTMWSTSSSPLVPPTTTVPGSTEVEAQVNEGKREFRVLVRTAGSEVTGHFCVRIGDQEILTTYPAPHEERT